MSWTKARYLQLAKNCAKLSSISHFQLSLESASAPAVRLYSVPLVDIDVPTDPVVSAVNQHHPAAILLQVEPLRYVANYRKLTKVLLEVAGKGGNEGGKVELAPRGLEECTVTRQNLEVMAQRYTGSLQDAKEIFTNIDPDPFLTFMKDCVYSSISRWPYLHLSIFPAIQSKLPIVLCDIPDALHRCMLANSLTIAEVREVFECVVTDLREHYRMNNAWRSPEDSVHSQFPHIFSPHRDRYISAIVGEAAAKYGNVAVFLGAHHAEPLIDMWQEKASIANAVAVPLQKAESDSDLIEKHAILEVILRSEAFQQDFLPHSFPYLFPDSVNNAELQKAKKRYEELFKSYENRLDEEVLVPDSLALDPTNSANQRPS